MEKIASEVGERPLDERSPDWIKRFLPDTSLVAITSDEQVQEIVNERIDEIIKWEDEKYERIKEILKGSDNGPGGPPVDYIKIKITLLEKSKNLILTGAPGTGKTYLARQIAQAMMPENISNPGDHIGFVQFHPSYDYTDFVERLRPFGTE
jgi:SpoVK/Ycf46/Vps4 family AAA+-type ATPase